MRMRASGLPPLASGRMVCRTRGVPVVALVTVATAVAVRLGTILQQRRCPGDFHTWANSYPGRSGSKGHQRWSQRVRKRRRVLALLVIL
jgi:hypothetical protein